MNFKFQADLSQRLIDQLLQVAKEVGKDENIRNYFYNF
jgi:hypothetical protein